LIARSDIRYLEARSVCRRQGFLRFPEQKLARTFAYLQYLPAFQATARLGSIRGAASELRLSASAVSLQIKRLSELTGISLFEKSGRAVRLTAAGREFSRAIGLALGQIDVASQASRNMRASAQRTSLSISVPASLGVAWMSSALVAFAETHDISALTINEASTASEVDWNVNDLAIVYDNPPFQGRFSRLLSEVRLQVVCSPVLFPRLDLRRGERKLGTLPLLCEDQGADWEKWAIAARVSLQGAMRVYVGSVGQAIASAVQGRGIALVSDVLTRHHINEGRLIQPFQVSINANSAYYILSSTERSSEPLIQFLCDAVSDHLANVPDQPS